MDTIDYWDNEERCQKQRIATPDEQEEINARKSSAVSIDAINAPILAALMAIDAKTPRAIREAVRTGDNSRVLSLESEAIILRYKLIKG